MAASLFAQKPIITTILIQYLPRAVCVSISMRQFVELQLLVNKLIKRSTGSNLETFWAPGAPGHVASSSWLVILCCSPLRQLKSRNFELPNSFLPFPSFSCKKNGMSKAINILTIFRTLSEGPNKSLILSICFLLCIFRKYNKI